MISEPAEEVFSRIIALRRAQGVYVLLIIFYLRGRILILSYFNRNRGSCTLENLSVAKLNLSRVETHASVDNVRLAW